MRGLMTFQSLVILSEYGCIEDVRALCRTLLQACFRLAAIEARFNVPLATQPHELTVQQMADVLFRIVQVEGPVHEDELTARVRDLWGLGRAGSRIQDSVARGIRALLVSGRCQREDDCLFLPEAPVPVRSREVVRSASLRKADLLPPQELRAAIAHYGASPSEIAVAVSRLLGFKSHECRTA
jgi:hypothetical protein